jgi:hypothetical protein
VQALLVHPHVPDHGEQGLDLGREGEDLLVPVVVQGEDAQPVPHEVQVPGPGVVHGVGELTPQQVNSVHPVTVVDRQQRLGVAGRAERVIHGSPQIAVVENLPVEADAEPAVGRGHRLGRRLQVDDGEAGMAQPHRAAHDNPLVVRAAVAQARRHRRDRRGIGGAAIGIDKAYDSAHRMFPLWT